MTTRRLGYAAQFFFGGWFLFHGLNWWLHYFPEKSFAPGAHGLIPELIRLGIFDLVKVMEVVIGIALLADAFVPLAIVAAVPITLVIVMLNLGKASAFGIGVAVVATSLIAVMALAHLDRYLPMLAFRAGAPSAHGLRAWLGGGPQPPLNRETLPPGRLAVAILLGIALPAAVTYASIAWPEPGQAAPAATHARP